MARLRVKYTCGCGYSTDKLEEAIKHSDEKSHTLTATGTIEKE